MSRYCVDTSAYSFFQRADEPVVELFDSAEWLGIPATVLAQLPQLPLQNGNFLPENRRKLLILGETNPKNRL